MRGIVIRSKSKEGNDALVRNQKETREAKFLARQQLKLAYKVRFENERQFYRLFIFGRSKYITPQTITPVAIEMMASNGAEEGLDYVIEEVEE